jgi:Nif-specific regulatory protein
MSSNLDASIIKAFSSQQQLAALHRISMVMSRNLDVEKGLEGMLGCLQEEAQMQLGMVVLYDDNQKTLMLDRLHGVSAQIVKDVSQIRYRLDEGIIGQVMRSGESAAIPCLADDPRFLDRLNLYDYTLPFICVPILGVDANPIGVLAAQPMQADGQGLSSRTRFLEVVANLVGQMVRLIGQADTQAEVIRAERDSLRRKVRSQHGFANMVGKTPLMRQVFDSVRQVAKWDTTVLIRGESGTGKELIANAIHYNSPRAGQAFIKLNCAALPENLLESELFGHEKGAFTGAVKQRKGRFEMADGGTIFLDEIGEISPMFQAKLLRVLQEGEFERVGGAETLKVDARVVTATNKDLEKMVLANQFREDLYYRLNVMPIQVPALRERIEDIGALGAFLLEKLGSKQNRKLRISEGAVRMLMEHPWPGNVRELENCLERAAILSESGLIDRDMIILEQTPGTRAAPTGLATRLSSATSPVSPGAGESLDERQRVIAALEESGWVQAKAARILGMTPRQIAYRIQTMNIKMRRL